MLFDGNFAAANDGHGIALMTVPDQTAIKKNAVVGQHFATAVHAADRLSVTSAAPHCTAA